MKMRASRRRPRAMLVCRSQAWGSVLYVRKRAYWWGMHCPADEAGLRWAAMIQRTEIRDAAAIELEEREAEARLAAGPPKAPAKHWAELKSAEEILADIRSLFERLPKLEFSPEVMAKRIARSRRTRYRWIA